MCYSYYLLESVLEFFGHSSEVFGFPHDFADEPLLAVQVIVVELFVQVLEHGDPLDDVHSLVAISIIVGPNEKKNQNEFTVMEMYKSETSHHHRNVIIIILSSFYYAMVLYMVSRVLWILLLLIRLFDDTCSSSSGSFAAANQTLPV